RPVRPRPPALARSDGRRRRRCVRLSRARPLAHRLRPHRRRRERRGVSAMSVPHPDPISGASYSAVELAPDDRSVILLDQRALPGEERYQHLSQVEEVARAIEHLAVRGAPAIGIAAGYAMVLAAAAEPGPSAALPPAT